MFIGILEIDIYIYEAASLKEKRSVIRSIIERLRSRYNISIAEVDNHDIWNKSTLGISMVSNNKKYLNQKLEKILDFIDMDGRVEIIKENIEII